MWRVPQLWVMGTPDRTKLCGRRRFLSRSLQAGVKEVGSPANSVVRDCPESRITHCCLLACILLLLG